MEHKTEAIWTKFSPQLKLFILKRVSDESVADDILQEVFKKVHSHIGTLKDDSKVERWIYQITRNTIIDHYRTQKIEEDIPQDIPVFEKLPEKIDSKTGFTSIKAIIETLPQPYAQALLMTEFEGLTQKELAQRLEISVSGAKSRVQRARKMLKTKLSDDYFGSWVGKFCTQLTFSEVRGQITVISTATKGDVPLAHAMSKRARVEAQQFRRSPQTFDLSPCRGQHGLDNFQPGLTPQFVPCSSGCRRPDGRRGPSIL